MKEDVTLLAIVNLILMPAILFFQIFAKFYNFFNCAEILRRDPGTLGVRKWSQYAQLYLRHYNEFDHQFQQRLRLAYKPANRYMNTFFSPLLSVASKFITFIAGSMLGVLLSLSVWNE